MSQSPNESAVETLVFKNDSLIDAVFTSRQQRRVVWATLTSGASTTVYAVSPEGKLKAAACIQWHGRTGSRLSLRNNARSTVEIGGDEFTTEQFGWQVRRGALVADIKSKYFNLGTYRCRWKPQSSGSHFDQTQFMSDAMTWVCEAEHVDVGQPSPASSSSRLCSILRTLRKPPALKMRLAVFCPSYNFSRHGGDLAIYADGVPWTVWLLVSLILMHVKEEEWVKVQSNVSADALEAALARPLQRVSAA